MAYDDAYFLLVAGAKAGISYAYAAIPPLPCIIAPLGKISIIYHAIVLCLIVFVCVGSRMGGEEGGGGVGLLNERPRLT